MHTFFLDVAAYLNIHVILSGWMWNVCHVLVSFSVHGNIRHIVQFLCHQNGFSDFVLEFCASVWIGFMHTSKTVDSWYSLFSHSSSLLLAILQNCKILISFHFLCILHLTVILELQGRVWLLSSVYLQKIFWWSVQINESGPLLYISRRSSDEASK